MRVLNALYWDLAVPRDRLNVDVENGWVTVSGMVDLPYQRSCAESDAKSVPGVVGVTNLIRLAAAQAAAPRPRDSATPTLTMDAAGEAVLAKSSLVRATCFSSSVSRCCGATSAA